MRSSWTAELRAVVRKEWQSERRARHGFWTASLFSVTAVTGMAFASYGLKPPAQLAAGILAVILLFTAVTAVPRTFLVEDEQGTLDLLRLLARPEIAFLGKLLAVLAQLAVQTVVLATLFIVLTGTVLIQPGLFVYGLTAYALTLSAIVSLAGALAAGSANRWLLAGAVGMPLLLPTVALAVGVFRTAFGAGFTGSGWQSATALLGFGVISLALAPWLVHGLWGRDPAVPPSQRLN